jgi:hypothetical protein
MKQVAATLMFVVVGALVAGSALEAGDKDKTLKGSITCAKCDLKVEGQKKCYTVIVVKKGDKELVYWFDEAGSKKYHKDICTSAKPGSVTGTTSKKGDKLMVKVKSVEYD